MVSLGERERAQMTVTYQLPKYKTRGQKDWQMVGEEGLEEEDGFG